MRDYIILLLIAGGLPVTLFRPFFGLMMWCWIAYMVPHKLGWGLAAHLPVASAVGATFLLAFLFSKEPKKLPMNQPIIIVYLLMLAWWTLSFVVNPATDYALQQADKVLKIQLFTIITIMMVNTRERLFWLVGVIALSIASFGVKGGIFTVLTGGDNRVWGPPGGFFEGNNEFGLTLLTILPLLRFLQLQATKSWQKHALTASMLSCFVAALGTHSRGALLAAAAMSAFFWWKSPSKLPILLAGVILIPTLYFFMPESWHERMSTIKVEDSGGGEQEFYRNTDTSTWCGQMTDKIQRHDLSAGGRVNAWCFAINVALHHPVGGGFEAFNPESFLIYAPDPTDFHDAHSIYFKILGEHGFVGLALFLTLLALSWFRAGKLQKLATQKNMIWAAQLAAMMQVSLLAFCVGGVFLGLCYFDLLYHLIAIVVILDVLIQKGEVNPAGTVPPASTEASHGRLRFANVHFPSDQQGQR
ncbi:MAG: putative O-glycosylation ligase, exosortase A system-associated [Permianibacter sp.]